MASFRFLYDETGTPRPWVWPAVIALLAIAASLSGITNQWTQDEIAIIWGNPRMHDLRAVGRFFVDPYWPPPFVPALYRPFASVSYALEWAASGGTPLLFRITSYLLYAACSVLVFRLARLRLPLVAAAMVGALFAVHPVHVEAVALAVNQNELWVALISSGAVVLYLRERSSGSALLTRSRLILVGLYLAGCLFKENAFVLPGLLLAAEVLLVRTAEPLATRIAQGRRLLLPLVLVAVTVYWVRTQVLHGNLAGDSVAEGLVGQTVAGRALTMLSVVPHWFRLLFWPAHLQADYNPSEIVAQTAWGPMQTLGLLLLVATLLVALAAWRRAPVLTFGVAWCAVALFPVHNVIVSTGIVLAERTLFLPSIGAMLALGGLGAFLLERGGARVRLALAAAAGALIVLGVYRSTTRHPVWKDQFTLWYRTANVDAPRSFHGHEALADAYFNIGVEKLAESEYRLAIALSPKTIIRTKLAYADKLRSRGFCYRAAQLYREALDFWPPYQTARASLIACALDLGRYREAMFHARMGISFEWERPVFQLALATAEKALRDGAPPGTIRLVVPEKLISSPYLKIGSSPSLKIGAKR
ncbi:MAG TPA: tetratricopeptide repeat protein [Gemmatimonadales bacterium]|nr:tetratricopeptide repeat protein [Gemmatimonadales bacterium]